MTGLGLKGMMRTHYVCTVKGSSEGVLRMPHFSIKVVIYINVRTRRLAGGFDENCEFQRRG
jgi:hypothetical protein